MKTPAGHEEEESGGFIHHRHQHRHQQHHGNLVEEIMRCCSPRPPPPGQAQPPKLQKSNKSRRRSVPKTIIFLFIIPPVLYNFVEFSKNFQQGWQTSLFSEQQQQPQQHYEPTRNLQQHVVMSSELPPPPESSSSSSPAGAAETIHFMFGLHGSNNNNNIDAEFFFDEWEVALKSLLMNAPLDNPLHIHIIANQIGHNAVVQRLTRHKIIGSLWRNPITITVYNVEQRLPEFVAFIKYHLRGDAPINQRVSLGGYYRLLSPMILPKGQGIGSVAYMDTDSVIMSNVGELWKHVNSSYTFQGSSTWLCSAFIIINIDKAMKFWGLLDQLPNKRVDGKGDSSDQTLLQMVTNANPEILGSLPVTWDTHLGHGHRRRPQDILGKRPNGVGFLHFNGVRPNYFSGGGGGGAVNLQHYCDRTPECRGNPQAQKLFEQTWMLANYYIQIPWEWALYIGGVSKIPPEETHGGGGGGHPLRFVEVISNSTTSWSPSRPPNTTTTNTMTTTEETLPAKQLNHTTG